MEKLVAGFVQRTIPASIRSIFCLVGWQGAKDHVRPSVTIPYTMFDPQLPYSIMLHITGTPR